MAGDWTKMRDGLQEEPEVIGISRATGLDVDAVVGKLLRVWSWAGRVSRDGYVSVALHDVDHIAKHDGFALAMEKVGWLKVSHNCEVGVTFPKFDRHNSKPAKVRAQAKDRMAASRNRCASRVTKAQPEKRREEKRKKKTSVSSSSAPAEPAEQPKSDRPRDELFDAVAEITGADPKVSGGHIGKVCAALRKADPPYTPDEVRRLPGVLAEQGWTVPVTVGVVEKYIGWVRTPPAKAQPPPRNGRPTRDDFFDVAMQQAYELKRRQGEISGPGAVHELGEAPRDEVRPDG